MWADGRDALAKAYDLTVHGNCDRAQRTGPMLPYSELLRQIGADAQRLGLEAYAVGGIVRDAILGRDTTDIDVLAVGPGSGIALAKAFAISVGAGKPAVYTAFGTAAVSVPPQRVPLGPDESPPGDTLVIEFVGARRESYRSESRKPIVEDGTLSDDLARRDFTVNALAASLAPNNFGDIIDQFDGRADIEARVLRTPLDPAVTFDDDPLRMLRAARFAAQLGFEVATDTVAAMADQAARIAIVSAERITDELSKLLAAPVPSIGLGLLFRTGVLEHILPEVTRLAGVEEVGGRAHKDNFWHTLEVVDNLAYLQSGVGVGTRASGFDLWLRWAALLHDIGKAETKRWEPGTGWTFHGHEDVGPRRLIPAVFRRLRLPLGEPLDFVQNVVRLHHRPTALVDANVTDSAVRRLIVDAGQDIDDLMLLVRADVTSKNARRARKYLAGFDRVEARMKEVDERDNLRAWQPPVDGNEIINELGLDEGLAVGILKAWIREAVLDGVVPNEHDPAWAFVLARKDDAVRRADLFQDAVRNLRGADRRHAGAIKDAVFWDEIPADANAARAHLDGLLTSAVSENEGSPDASAA